jgi:hypothetical protein
VTSSPLICIRDRPEGQGRVLDSFYDARDRWAQKVYHRQRLKARAKVIAAVLAAPSPKSDWGPFTGGYFKKATYKSEFVLRACPSQETLARASGQPRRVVRLAIRELEEADLLLVTEGEPTMDGSKLPNKIYTATGITLGREPIECFCEVCEEEKMPF